MIIDALTNTIQFKIVYFGPAMSGKTTSIKLVLEHFGKKEELCSVYGIISFQKEDWKLKINLYSCTEQDFYIVTRPVTLKGVDGIVFVADSQNDAWERNLVSWNELKRNYNEKIETVPLIMAFNKQDLPNKFNPNDFLKEINFKLYRNKEVRYTIALNGENILSCFEEILNMILMHVYKKTFI